jgi:hypothetical protein
MYRSDSLRNFQKLSEDKMEDTEENKTEDTKPTVINIEQRMVLLLNGIGAISAFVEYMAVQDTQSEKLLELMKELGMPEVDMDQRFIETFTKCGKAGEA